jgi:hypothetical protein
MMRKKTMKFRDGGTSTPKPKPKPKPFGIQSPEQIAKDYGGNKHKPPAAGTNGLNIPEGGYNDPYERMPPKYKPPPPKPLGPAGKKGYAAGGVTKIMPTSKQMGDLNMAKGGVAKAKAKTKAKTKAMMAAAMMKDRMGRAMAARGNKDLMGRAMAARGAEAPMAPAGPPMGMGMKKGGKAKAKPFAATKFGAAMMKKSDDTKGRAMKKFAKGGGIESRGKTKGKRVTMKNGGSC